MSTAHAISLMTGGFLLFSSSAAFSNFQPQDPPRFQIRDVVVEPQGPPIVIGREWEEAEQRRDSHPIIVREDYDLVVGEAVIVSGYNVDCSTVAMDFLERPVIKIDFDEIGATALAKLTNSSEGRAIAFVLDDVVISMPRVEEPIDEGQIEVSLGGQPDLSALSAIINSQARGGQGC